MGYFTKNTKTPSTSQPNPKHKHAQVSCQLLMGQWSMVKPGQILILALVMLAVFTMLILSTYSKLTRFALFSRNAYQKELAVNLADGGIDYALSQLNIANPSFSVNLDCQSPPTAYEILNYSSLGKVQIVTCNNNGFEKKITSTACIPVCGTGAKYKQQVYFIAALSDNAQQVSLSKVLQATSDIQLQGT